MNIQQQNTSEVADTETVMDFNEYLDPPPPQEISDMFALTDLSSHSSSDSAKYECAWIKAKVIFSYILSAGKYTDACIRALYIALNYKEIASIMAVNGAIFPKECSKFNYLV